VSIQIPLFQRKLIGRLTGKQLWPMKGLRPGILGNQKQNNNVEHEDHGIYGDENSVSFPK